MIPSAKSKRTSLLALPMPMAFPFAMDVTCRLVLSPKCPASHFKPNSSLKPHAGKFNFAKRVVSPIHGPFGASWPRAVATAIFHPIKRVRQFQFVPCPPANPHCANSEDANSSASPRINKVASVGRLFGAASADFRPDAAPSLPWPKFGQWTMR